MHPQQGTVGWGPTIREINFLAQHWSEIVHVACLEKSPPVGSSLPYSENNISFIPIPTFGGRHWWQKIDILYKSPRLLLTIHRALKGATEVQIRLPMGIGLVLLLFFKLKRPLTYKLWVKYANNWGKTPSSLSYRLQQRLLHRNWIECPVTINGAWPDQPSHCKTFPNPCLTEEQFQIGGYSSLSKPIQPPYTFIFIGRLDADKGVDLLINSISNWPQDKIFKFHFVGDGPLAFPLRKTINSLGINAYFHGLITQELIFELLKESHFLVLPSRSEGFPKVVAEGLNFGCLPIVTAVGSVTHYIKNGNSGIIISEQNEYALTSAILEAIALDENKYREMIEEGRKVAQKFTFEAYFKLLNQVVFNAL